MAAPVSVQSSVSTRTPYRFVQSRLPRPGRPARLLVRCSAEQEQPSEQIKQSTNPPSSPLPQEKLAAPKVSTKFSDILAFSGPAPERINGRLAMVGFVAAIGAEVASGDSVMAQIANGGLPWFVGTAAVLSLASLIPLIKGSSVPAEYGGIMNSNAELWNGRFAMLGIVALVFTEYVIGGALV